MQLPNLTPQGQMYLFFYFLLLKYKYLSPRIHLESFKKFPGKKVSITLLQAILPYIRVNDLIAPIGGSSDSHTMWSVVGGQYPPKRHGVLKIPHLLGVDICCILYRSRVKLYYLWRSRKIEKLILGQYTHFKMCILTL